MIHKYHLNGFYIVIDTYSGAVHVVDKIIYDILDFITEQVVDIECPREILDHDNLKQYSTEDIKEGYEEIKNLCDRGQLFGKDEYEKFVDTRIDAPVKAMCLHVAHDCNLRCSYCFASTGDFGTGRKLMSIEIGKKAIDFLINQSKDRKNLELDFFGGEPLMNLDVIKEIVSYGRSKEKEHNKKFRFTITTNGVLLDDDSIDFINKEMSNVVLSLDGRREINDKMRKRVDKAGCYDDIVPKFQKLVESRNHDNYYIRGTFTKYNLDFTDDVVHFSNLGFDQISIEPVVTSEKYPYAITSGDLPRIFEEYETLSNEIMRRSRAKKNISDSKGEKEISTEDQSFNFFHFMIDLDGGPCAIKRLRGCGCGNEYVAVTPDGDIYPCHQFVGMSDWKMGNVIDNSLNLEIKKAFASSHIYNKEDCRKCWAKFYCSGGCNANNLQYAGGVLNSHKLSCKIMKKRIECAIMLKAFEASLR